MHLREHLSYDDAPSGWQASGDDVCDTMTKVLQKFWWDQQAPCQTLPPKVLSDPVYNDAAREEPPSDATFVFVGGLHYSGTSAVERLISSHPEASGLRPDLVTFETDPQLEGCLWKAATLACRAAENEGLFLTKQFQRLHPRNRCNQTLCLAHNCTCPRCSWPPQLPTMGFQAYMPNFEWTATFPPAVDFGKVRRTLWADWSPFWEVGRRDGLKGHHEGRHGPRLFVEKDIPTLSRALFLQSVFGAARSRFVIVVRHPLHEMRDNWLGLGLQHLFLWLRAHEAMRASLRLLRSHFLFQLEWLTTEPETCVSALSHFVGLDLRFERRRYVDDTPAPGSAGRALNLHGNSHHVSNSSPGQYGPAGARHEIFRLQTGTSPDAVAKAEERNRSLARGALRCIPDLEQRLGDFGYSLHHLDPNQKAFFALGRRPLSSHLGPS